MSSLGYCAVWGYWELYGDSWLYGDCVLNLNNNKLHKYLSPQFYYSRQPPYSPDCLTTIHKFPIFSIQCPHSPAKFPHTHPSLYTIPNSHTIPRQSPFSPSVVPIIPMQSPHSIYTVTSPHTVATVVPIVPIQSLCSPIQPTCCPNTDP